VEQIDLILAVNELASTALSEVAIFYSALTAYLLVAYLVGERLTFFQTGLVNLVFIFTALMGIHGVLGIQGMILEVMQLGGNELGSRATKGTMYAHLAFRLLVTIGAMLFMWQVRHPKTE
jgi:hypothetical protein